MIRDLLLHEQTRTEVDRYIVHPSHALLLVGGVGTGKGTITQTIAKTLLQRPSDSRAGENILEMLPIKGTFTIDQVRAIQQFIKLKTVGNGAIKRVILLHDIHLMNAEAQNALLKVLEEPPMDTVLIMTAIPGDVLLPTIYSRLQKIQIHIPDEESSNSYFQTKGFSAENIKKMYVLSGGHTGLLNALLTDNDDHPLVAAIEQAKRLVTATRYDKMLAVESLSKNREDVILFLQATKRIALAALQNAAKQDKHAMVARWYQTLELIQRTEETTKSNPNNKLLLTHIMLNL